MRIPNRMWLITKSQKDNISNIFLMFFVIIWAVMLQCSEASALDARIDRFVGNLVLKDFEGSNYRKYKLGEDIKYIDPRGKEWFAWEGLETDGATIPPFLWSIVGSPYTGNYRRAAIMHDFYCTNIFREWPSVSNMFYDAMITDGVNKYKALIMYYAVVRFGPKWSLEEIQTCPANKNCFKPGDLLIKKLVPKISSDHEADLQKEMTEIKQMIENKNIEKIQIDQIISQKKTIQHETIHDKKSDNWIEYRWRHK